MFYDGLTVDEIKDIACCTYIIETRLDVDWVHLVLNRGFSNFLSLQMEYQTTHVPEKISKVSFCQSNMNILTGLILPDKMDNVNN